MTKSRYELLKEIKELKGTLGKEKVSMPWQIHLNAQTFKFQDREDYDRKVSELVRAGVTYFNVEKVSK